mmetsp:Transcript_43870/g.31966  ORF Transcript_43870/g.31966 Transcript_43870/m.31966 type:complete len:161 (-) Transcript_43870:49-531(-)
MRTFFLLALILTLVVFQADAQRSRSSSSSSSAVASSSSSVASSSSSSNVTNNSSNNDLYYGADCADEIGDGIPDPCEAVDSDWCCYYQSSKLGDGPKYESWTCLENPSFWEDLYDDATDLISEVTTDDEDEYETEAYCANAVVAKLSAILVGFLAFVFVF